VVSLHSSTRSSTSRAKTDNEIAEKYILALGCLNAASAIDANSPIVHEQAVAFRFMLNNKPELPAKVAKLLNSEFQIISPSTDLKALNDKYLSEHKQIPGPVISAIKVQRLLGEDKVRCEKELAELLSVPDFTFSDAVMVLDLLKTWKSSETEAFQKAALSKWPGVTRLQ
jgi:hypothetical protein